MGERTVDAITVVMRSELDLLIRWSHSTGSAARILAAADTLMPKS
jgi:hypothetical protein